MELSRYSIIDLNALGYNFSAVKQKVGSALVMPIVKANAYGHGIVECAQFFEQQGAYSLGVAFIEEAIQLRKVGIQIPIVVLGSIFYEQIPLFLEYSIDATIASIEKLKQVDACAQKYGVKARVHLKIDTGLGRIGVRASSAEQFFLAATRLKNIEIVGVCSHFATSDSPDTAYMYEQCERFYQSTLFFEKYSLPMPLRHIANSGAIMQYPESYFDMVRPGIMLYGIYPQTWMTQFMHLKMVLSLHARVVYFKVVQQGSGVSYGLTWRANKDTRIITIPVGYGDGYPRTLSNKGVVLIQGKRYPIVGAICMDQMMIDLGEGSAYNGDEVTLIGSSGDNKITINELADLCGNSPYEMLVMLNLRIQRYYRTIENELNTFSNRYSAEKTKSPQ